jgi:hypothetical protein
MSETSRFEPFRDSLKNRWNLVFVVLGILCLVDFFTGSLLSSQVVLGQMKLMQVDPARKGYAITTIFGTFREVITLARVFDRAGAIIFLFFPLWSFGRGFIASLGNR